MFDPANSDSTAGTFGSPPPVPGEVMLDYPITRGETVIDKVVVRKPNAGSLRGLTLMALSQLDVAALHTLLPRITTPTLTKADLDQLDLADLMQLGGEVMDFLLPKAAKSAASPTE